MADVDREGETDWDAFDKMGEEDREEEGLDRVDGLDRMGDTGREEDELDRLDGLDRIGEAREVDREAIDRVGDGVVLILEAD
jgi:hypothetical protein